MLVVVLPVCLVLFGGSVASSSRADQLAALAPASPEAPSPPENRLAAAAFSGEMERYSRFIWPAIGPLTSYVGPGHPTGIDIGLNYGEDSLIRAAAAGTIIYAGGSACCGYGLHVEIEHDDGWRTLYAHFSRMGVEEGMYVQQGALLGAGGATGFAIGKHLHFELYKDDEIVDPLLYMPPEQVQSRPMTPFSCPSTAPLFIDPGSQTLLRWSADTGYSLKQASVEPLAGGDGEPEVLVAPAGPVDLTIDAGVPGFPNGRNYEYRLGLTLEREGVEQELDCTLSLRTMQSFPTMVRVQPLIPTATRRPSSTATRVSAGNTPAPDKPASTSTRRPTVHQVNTATPKPSSSQPSPVARTPTPRR
jgi:hypothetical protein